MRLIALLLFMLASAADARGGSVVAAGGHWAAVIRGDQCDAESRTVAITGKGTVAAIAGFTFASGKGRWGQFHARLSRVPRAGASVIAGVGGQQFLLVSSGQWAWSRDSRQDEALIAAVRSADALRIQSRDGAGRRFTDHYPLDFAPTAIDAAAARCASLQTGKSR